MIVIRVSLLVLLLGSPLGALSVSAAESTAPAPLSAKRGTLVDPSIAVAPDDGHLAEWPALADEATAKREVARLRKAETEEMGLDAAARIREAGAGLAPLLGALADAYGLPTMMLAVAALPLLGLALTLTLPGRRSATSGPRSAARE